MFDLTNHPTLKLSYHVQGRNGHYVVEEFANTDGSRFEGCTRLVEVFKTRKLADSVCSALQELACEINKLRGLGQ